MNILETLNVWDTNLFLWLNSCHNPFFDQFMYWFSDTFVWLPFYLAVIFVVIKKWRKESIWIILAFFLCILIADQIASGLLKGWVQRPRPSREISIAGLVHSVNGYIGGRFGFVSSHAANSFGFALLSSFIFRKKFYTYIVFLWAAVTAYSRIYLGVHYPGDILGGIVVGVFAALVCYFLLKLRKPTPSISPLPVQTNIPLIGMLLVVIGIAIYSFVLPG